LRTTFRLRRAAVPAVLLTLFGLALAVPRPAAACSICRCGDPTFNALGTDVYGADPWHIALDAERFDKDQGGEEGTESVVENRLTATLSYTFAERFVAVARIPYSSRRQTSDAGVESTHDLADPELYGVLRLWSSSFAPGLGRRTWLSLTGGVKTDWGKNDLTGGGVRLDEHLQAGTGAVDVFGGLSGVHLFDARSSIFASVSYRRTGTNRFGYRYGNSTLANVGYERKLSQRLDGVLELNYRDAGRDRIDAEAGLDPNTGGQILYVTPKVSVDFGSGLVGRAAVQIPAIKSLHGIQTERAVANVGLTYLF
jgi:hypothetical protein